MIQVKEKSLIGFVALDAALVAMACLVPAASHLFAVPLFKFNPMLAVLLAGMLIGRDWRNSMVLAVLLPLVSSLLTGMPVAPKMVCMMAEMATVVGVFAMVSRRWKALPAILTAIMAGKAVYYGLKAIVVAPAVLVGTDWKLQLLAVLLWGGLFALLHKRVK